MSIAITNSDRATFRECERKHFFSSHLACNLAPIETPGYLTLGTAIHKGLEAHYNGQDALEAFTACEGLDADMAELGIAMLRNYVNHWNDKFEVVATEYTFEVPIPNFEQPVVYRGKVDLLYKSKDGAHYIMDHKTCGQFGSMDYLKLDEQLTSYIWAMQKELDIYIAGGVLNELKKVAPAPVRVLKNGKLSVSTSNLVTLQDYRAAILEHGLEKEDYRDYLTFLKNRPSPFFRRTKTVRNRVQLERFEQRLYEEAVRILKAPNIMYGLPSPSSRNCNYCAFRQPCIAVEDGSDVTALLQLLYKERTYDTVG